MPSYGSLNSPSLMKMDNSRYGRKGMQMSNILGDPFALATISISLLAWFISFIATIIARVETTNEPEVPTFTWWAIVYSLYLIIMVFVVVACDAIHTYHVSVTGFLSAGIPIVTLVVNNLVYSKSGAREAAAAGFILLSMIIVVWVFYFGSNPSSTPRAFIDSFALAKESATMHRSTINAYGGTGRPETSNSVQPPQMYTSAQLSGFENPSPVAGVSQVNGARGSALPQGFTGGGLQPSKPTGPGNDAEVVPPTEYPYRAKAIYSYEANPDDANEIAFSKHEILEVSDVSGRWWQARKETGETGIAPSNYLILL